MIVWDYSYNRQRSSKIFSLSIGKNDLSSYICHKKYINKKRYVV